MVGTLNLKSLEARPRGIGPRHGPTVPYRAFEVMAEQRRRRILAIHDTVYFRIRTKHRVTALAAVSVSLFEL